MRHLLIALFCLFSTVISAKAQDFIASYSTLIGPADRVNSQGVIFTDFGAIIQQDRANYHRFGLRDDLDMADPVFSNADYRARIPAIWLVMRGSEYVVDEVLSGQPQLLSVLIYGYGGEPAFIIVMEGAG